MIPTPPFYSVFFCDRHRKYKVHQITFLSYFPGNDTVDFEAICCDCENEIEADLGVIGFRGSLPVKDWERIAPQPVLN
jgi:hypothetical protein